MGKVEDFFELESTRSSLARKGSLRELLRTYSSRNPQLNNQNTPELWNKLNASHETGKAKSPMEFHKLTTTVSMIKGDAPKVLNIGFGSGNLEDIYFKGHSNASWHGIDISPASVKKAKSKHKLSSFKLGNVLDIKYDKEFFDYVVALEVLEHIQPSETFTALAEIKRVLRVGGKFILSVPVNEGLKKMIEQGDNPNAHVRDYSSDLIRSEIEIAGMRVLSVNTFFAFHEMYTVKSCIARMIPGFRSSNGVLLLCEKLE